MPENENRENRRSSRPGARIRARSSGVEAAAVRRLAARQTPPSTPAPETTPTSETTSSPEATSAPETTAAPETTPVSGKTSARSWGLLAFVALAIVTLVGGGLAAWFGTEAGALTSQPSARNQALSDPGETSQVTSQVSSAVNALFSYDYAKPAPTQKAQSSFLTGAAVKQYTTMFATVKQNAVKNKLVVTTTVSNAGVETLTGDTARVLVFATESDGSAGATTPATAEAMLAVNAVRVGSAWKIEGIDTFAS